MRYDTENEIKKLIKAGFDLELISFELDIPVEELKHIQEEMKIEEKILKSTTAKRYNAIEMIEKENEIIHLKMQQVRQRYDKLYLASDKEEVKKIEKISDEELKVIDSIIKNIEESIAKMNEQDKKEKRKTANIVLSQLKQIEQYQLTVEQAEKMNYLMNSKQLEKLRLNANDHIEQYMKRYGRIMVKKLAEAVDIAQSQTQDLDELRVLKRKITNKMLQDNPIVVGTVKTKIENKILRISQQNARDRIRNNVSANVENIISDLAQGTLDIQLANQIINEEANKRMDSKPKTRFSLTKEQERKQILIQIKTCLMEKAEKYHIENPEITVMKIVELCDGNMEDAIRIVIENLIKVKDFERAKETCKQISEKKKGESFLATMKLLKNRIRNAEIGDIVLKGINAESLEEEKMYFGLIEKGLKMGNVKLAAIPLGKSSDGLRNITLANIWETENERANN